MDKKPLIFIVISASLFGIRPPFAQLLVKDIPPVALAGLLYLGAFAGLSLYSFVIKNRRAGVDESRLLLQSFIAIKPALFCQPSSALQYNHEGLFVNVTFSNPSTSVTELCVRSHSILDNTHAFCRIRRARRHICASQACCCS